MPKVTIKNTPKTLKESLKRAVAFLEENKSGWPMYEDRQGCPCLIGSYFTKEQRKWIKDESLNGSSVAVLETKIGTENLLAMTGMNVNQCRILQQSFDRGRGVNLLESIKHVLAGKSVSIGTEMFQL